MRRAPRPHAHRHDVGAVTDKQLDDLRRIVATAAERVAGPPVPVVLPDEPEPELEEAA